MEDTTRRRNVMMNMNVGKLSHIPRHVMIEVARHSTIARQSIVYISQVSQVAVAGFAKNRGTELINSM